MGHRQGGNLTVRFEDTGNFFKYRPVGVDVFGQQCKSLPDFKAVSDTSAHCQSGERTSKVRMEGWPIIGLDCNPAVVRRRQMSIDHRRQRNCKSRHRR